MTRRSHPSLASLSLNPRKPPGMTWDEFFKLDFKDRQEMSAYMSVMGKLPIQYAEGTAGYEQFAFSNRKKNSKKVIQNALQG